MPYTDGNIIIGTSVDVGGIGTGLKKIQKQVNKIGKLSATILGVGALAKFGKQALDTASDLQEVQNVVDVTFKEMAYKVEDFCSTSIERFGMTELAAKRTAGQFAAMGNALDLTREQSTEMALQLTALSGDFASFYNISQEYSKIALQAVYTGETETLKRYGIVLTEANLQQFALEKGITKSVKKMTAQEKTLLRYNYIVKVTKDQVGDFERTQGSWANQTRILSQLWDKFMIVLGNGLITVLTPMITVLNHLIKSLITFSQTVGAILTRLFGIEWQSISDNASGIEDTADAMNDLGDAIEDTGKKLRKQLMPFDMLNNIVTSAGTADDLSGLSDLLLELPKIYEFDQAAASAIDDIVNKIHNLVELGNWVADSIVATLQNIPWNTFYESASNFGTGLAEFLNGLFDPEHNLFSELGKTIASALNTMLEGVFSFSTKFKWADFGQSLKNGINKFLSTYHFGTAGFTLGNLIRGLATSLYVLISDPKTWSELGDKIAQGINGFLNSMNVVDAVTGMNGWQTLGANIASLATGIKTMLITVLEKVEWDDVFKGLGDALGEAITVDTLEIVVGALVIKQISSIVLGAGLYPILKKILLVPLISALSSIFTVAFRFVFRTFSILFSKPAVTILKNQLVTMAEAGLNEVSRSSYIISSIKNFVKNFGKNLAIFFEQTLPGFIGRLKTAFKVLFDNILGGFGLREGLLDAFGPVVTTILGLVSVIGGAILAVVNFFSMAKDGFSWLNEILMVLGITLASIGAVILGVFSAPVAAIVGGIIAAVATVSILIKDNWEAIKETLSGVWKWIKEKVIDKVVKRFKTSWITTIDFFRDLWDKIKEIWVKLTTWFDTYIITPITSIFSGIATKIGQFFKGCWIIIKAVWIVAADFFKTHVVDPLIQLFTNLKTTVVFYFTMMWGAVKNIWQNVTIWFDTYVVQGIITYFNNLKQDVINIFTTLWNAVKLVWVVCSTWFNNNVIQPLQAKFAPLFSFIKVQFDTAWTTVKTVWMGVKKWFDNKVLDPLTHAFDTAVANIKFFFSTLWLGIKSGAKAAFNGIVGFFETAINNLIDGLNFFIKGFNKAVSWASTITGDSWTNIDAIQNVTLPRLAKGAVIPPNKEFMAILGDQKSGTNIEAPLETIVEAMIRALQAMDLNGKRDDEEIIINIDGETVFRVVAKHAKALKKRNGGKPVLA